MSYEAVEVIYFCPKHIEPASAPGPCPICGRQRIRCHPGDADDPCRKPLMSANGEVLSRAPLWWLRQTVIWLAKKAK